MCPCAAQGPPSNTDPTNGRLQCLCRRRPPGQRCPHRSSGDPAAPQPPEPLRPLHPALLVPMERGWSWRCRPLAEAVKTRGAGAGRCCGRHSRLSGTQGSAVVWNRGEQGVCSSGGTTRPMSRSLCGQRSRISGVSFSTIMNQVPVEHTCPLFCWACHNDTCPPP